MSSPMRPSSSTTLAIVSTSSSRRSSTSSSGSSSPNGPLPPYFRDIYQEMASRAHLVPDCNTSDYSENTTATCDSTFSGNFTDPYGDGPPLPKKKINPIIYQPSNKFYATDLADPETLRPLTRVEYDYPVLLLFRLIAVHDLHVASLYKKMTQVQYKMVGLYMKMANYNRYVHDVFLGRRSECPNRRRPKCAKKLGKLEVEEAALNAKEKRLAIHEMKLYEEECRCYIDTHEKPYDEKPLVKSQQGRKFAELERKAAYIERAYACHLRLHHKYVYNLTYNETILAKKRHMLDMRQQDLREREIKAKSRFFAICQNRIKRYVDNVVSKFITRY